MAIRKTGIGQITGSDAEETLRKQATSRAQWTEEDEQDLMRENFDADGGADE